MLVSWTLENFKSVGRELTLPLSPITVLVGANSAGKSTIIQSILLIKQTIQYATTDQPIALNGPLLKLGNFNDVKNVQSEGAGFRIGWKYDAHLMTNLFPSLASTVDFQTARYTPYNIVSEIEWITQFDIDPSAPKNELSLLQPSLTSCTVTAISDSKDSSHTAKLMVYRGEGQSYEASTSRKRAVSQSMRPQDLSYYTIGEIDPETNASILEDHPNGEIIGAALRHFFPFYVAVKFDVAQRRATQIADAICSLRRTVRFQREYAQLPAPPSLREIIAEWLTASSEMFPEQSNLFDRSQAEGINNISDIMEILLNLQRRLRYLRSGPLNFPSLQELQPRIVDALTRDSQAQIETELERPRRIFDANIQTRDFFENYVRYLGPLRDEPKPLYPLEALGNPTDVGYRGEHTAAVLHLNRYEDVTYVPSENFSSPASGSPINMARSDSMLYQALVDWLSYMGVIEGISTDDKGKFGHELQVKTPGIEKFHDLTNVGVGVSQVLPIVLMALLAPPGSLLIFEQPELHLHPRVQTRLADFFISIALAGKQCLLETHSEYLVHRLRRRIAEAPGDALTLLSKLYFVEREGGLTSCRAVDITKYGAILEWPTEFFDQSQVESEKILTAASMKRVAEKKLREETSNATRPRT